MADTNAAPAATSAPAGDMAADQKAYLDSLVKKHAQEIYDEIKQNKSIDQQKQLWRDNGIDPEALVASYPDLIEKSELLRKDNMSRTRKAKNIGEMTALATLTTMLISPTRIYNNNNFGKVVFSALGSMASGIVSYLAATKILTNKNRDESANVSVQSRDVLIYNLALLFEMKERRRLEGKPDPEAVKAPGSVISDGGHTDPSAFESGAMAAKQSLAASKAAVKSRKPGYVDQLKAESAATAVINKSIS